MCVCKKSGNPKGRAKYMYVPTVYDAILYVVIIVRIRFAYTVECAENCADWTKKHIEGLFFIFMLFICMLYYQGEGNGI